MLKENTDFRSAVKATFLQNVQDQTRAKLVSEQHYSEVELL